MILFWSQKKEMASMASLIPRTPGTARTGLSCVSRKKVDARVCTNSVSKFNIADFEKNKKICEKLMLAQN